MGAAMVGGRRTKTGSPDERRVDEAETASGGLSQKLKLPHPTVVHWPNESDWGPLQPLCQVALPLHCKRPNHPSAPLRTEAEPNRPGSAAGTRNSRPGFFD